MSRWRSLAAAVAFCLVSACTEAPQAGPAGGSYSRVATLAPSLTELVFAAGAGESLVGVSAYSDYPAAALELPRVGDAFAVDREQLVLLEPDLLLAWQGGTPAHVIEELRRSGFRVEAIRTQSLDDVAAALRRIGELTGRTVTAGPAARQFVDELGSLAEEYAGRKRLRVFYQVDARPLYTVNGAHYASEIISLCGGDNVFAALDALAPAVTVEAVIDKDPEVLLASTDAGAAALAGWDRWPALSANRAGNRYLVPADEIGRATPRLLSAARVICELLEAARTRLQGI